MVLRTLTGAPMRVNFFTPVSTIANIRIAKRLAERILIVALHSHDHPDELVSFCEREIALVLDAATRRAKS